jgi:IS4 transposase
MTGEQLQKLLMGVFGEELMKRLAGEYSLVQRERSLDVVRLVLALVLTGGTEESGRQYAILRNYLDSGAPQVVRGGFYAWFNQPLERLLTELLRRAQAEALKVPKLLPGLLSTVSDWRIVDSTTIKLDRALIEEWKGAGDYAALKIHKEWSVGLGNLVDYHLSPASEHDSGHLGIDATRRGTGLLMDLGYVSLQRLRDCEQYDVRYVIRLKSNWKVRLTRLVRGELSEQLGIETDLDVLLLNETLVTDDKAIDADVEVGATDHRVRCRLVGVPTPKGYCLFLTNLARKTHGPLQVGDLYRVRWEIEIDNKADKTGAQIDRITAQKPVSVRILILASLINATLARIIVQREKLALYASRETDPTTGQVHVTQPPLHPIQLVHCMRVCERRIDAALQGTAPTRSEWSELMSLLRHLGHDPNWRRRPSVLDQLQGLVAPPGRPRKSRGNEPN